MAVSPAGDNEEEEESYAGLTTVVLEVIRAGSIFFFLGLLLNLEQQNELAT
jgi:hypothetical protein